MTTEDGQPSAAAPANRRTEVPAESDRPPAVRTRRAPPKRKSFWRELPVILLVALVLSLLIKTFLLQAFYIPSGSMEDTLLVGDRVFVNKLAVRFGELQRGDIVVFKDPGGWLPEPEEETGARARRHVVRDGLVFIGLAPSDTGDDLIKRVIGVGGDRVACCDADGRITVNNVPLDESLTFSPVTSHRRWSSTSPCPRARSGSWVTTVRCPRTVALTRTTAATAWSRSTMSWAGRSRWFGRWTRPSGCAVQRRSSSRRCRPGEGSGGRLGCLAWALADSSLRRSGGR